MTHKAASKINEGAELSEEDVLAITVECLEKLGLAVKAQSPDSLRKLFVEDSYWRDAVALSWKLQTVAGAAAIAQSLYACAKSAGFTTVQIHSGTPPPQYVERVGRPCIEAYYSFTTNVGSGRGIIRLVRERDVSDDWKIWTLLTSLESLKDYPESTGNNRPVGQSYSRDFKGPNWLDKRLASQRYDDRDPTVLVVGGGQAGLSIAARLNQLGVDTLIIDKHQRIGDNWRKRYHALTLHNQLTVNHLPYLQYPPNWPVYIPKDKLANWFECYVEALELNFWCGHELTEAIYDESEQCWQATVTLTDGNTRQLRPRHIVMATGVSGIPNKPDLPGLNKFSGTVVHSGEYQDGEHWQGKNAIVVGTGNSGHDVAQDLASSGAEVTMIQRSNTLIVSIEPSAQLPYTVYDGSRSLEDTDLIAVSMPMPLMREAHIGYNMQSQELDKELLSGLEKIGFKLDSPVNNPGWQFKYLTRGGGYYFNVGCSDMLIDGQIKLKQFSDVSTFTQQGLTFEDGTEVPADLVVLATGYAPQEEMVEHIFGAAVRERIGPIWGYGDELELRNMYCETGQRGLWFIEGSFAQCRINSKFLALRIKAGEEDLINA